MNSASAKATPSEFVSIAETPLIKSLLKYYFDVSAHIAQQHNLPYLPACYTHQVKLTLSFLEPFDNFKTLSIIELWAGDKNYSDATQNLLQRLNNLYEYRDLLLTGYFAPISPFDTKYSYQIYDPQEVAKYKQISNLNLANGIYKHRLPLQPCGIIHTNAMLKTK